GGATLRYRRNSRPHGAVNSLLECWIEHHLATETFQLRQRSVALVPEDHQDRIEPRFERGAHCSTDHTLSGHLEEELVPTHPARGPCGEDHAGDAVTSIHRALHGMPPASGRE